MKNAKVGSTITLTKGKQFKVKLKGKVREKTLSLFLEYYKGYKEENGKTKPIVEREYLKRNILREPKTPIEKAENKKTMDFAEEVRMIRQQQSAYKEEGLLDPTLSRINFIEFMRSIGENKNRKENAVYRSMIKAFINFIKKDDIRPKELTEIICEEFALYLLKNYNGETPRTLFSKFKHCIKVAKKKDMFRTNPAEDVKVKAPEGLRKKVLTPDDIIKLSNTPCKHRYLKLAFLFSVNTGLRFCDIRELKWEDIEDGRLKIAQVKTTKHVHMKLNDAALKIINKLCKNTTYLFEHLPANHTCRVNLNNWVKDAGINKHITFHCARHTFATLLISNGVDIKTAADLMGHSGINHMVKYMHGVGELRDKAVDKLPEIEL